MNDRLNKNIHKNSSSSSGRKRRIKSRHWPNYDYTIEWFTAIAAATTAAKTDNASLFDNQREHEIKCYVNTWVFFFVHNLDRHRNVWKEKRMRYCFKNGFIFNFTAAAVVVVVVERKLRLLTNTMYNWMLNMTGEYKFAANPLKWMQHSKWIVFFTRFLSAQSCSGRVRVCFNTANHHPSYR